MTGKIGQMGSPAAGGRGERSRPWEAPAARIALVLLLGLAVYSNTLRVPFTFDDAKEIVYNGSLTRLQGFLLPDTLRQTRYLGLLSFALDYRVHGLDLPGYHLVNICIHLAAALAVYLLTALTLRTPGMVGSEGEETRSLALLPLLSALLFVAHPVQTQAVTYIVQRFTSLAALLYLLTLLLYVRGRLAAGRGAAGCYLLSLVCAAMAMKAKEISFTLPVAMLLYETIFFRSRCRERVVRLAPFFATMAIIPLSMFGTGSADGLGATARAVDHATKATGIGRLEYLETQFRVLVTYLRLLVWPANQNLDYDYPMYHSLAAYPVLLSLLLLASLLCLAWLLLKEAGRDPRRAPLRLVSFGILWFFLTLSVESSVIPLGDLIFEHRLYLPSFGVFLALATLFLTAVPPLRRRYPKLPAAAIPAVVSLLVVALAVAGYRRNEVWRSDVTLWADTASKSPGKARPWNNLGYSYLNQTDPVHALPALQKAIQIDPGYCEAWDNLGKALFQMGQPQAAEASYRRALAANPGYQQSWVNLGLALEIQGKLQEAVQCLRRAVELDGTDQRAKLYLEKTLQEMPG